MAVNLNKTDVQKLNRILVDLMLQAEADGCVVCDQAGHVLAQEGVAAEDPHLLSALGAGVFAATRELARLLGEDEFSVVLHQGTKRSILMCAASEDALIAVIFSSNASVGMVKLYTPPAAQSVRAILDDKKHDVRNAVHSDHGLFVLSDSDEVFGVK